MEDEVAYSRILWLYWSAAQRLPPESNARSAGPANPVEVTATAFDVKLDWPITRLAVSPVENGAAYSRTLLLASSATQRLPPWSNARPKGL